MLRIAREEEQRRRVARERRRDEDQREAQRLAAIERDWNLFKSGVEQVQRANMHRAFMQHLDDTFNELDAYFNPPAPSAPEPEIVYVEPSEGSNRLGTPDFNPKLFASPMR